jgi:hypothetical protein
MAAPKVLTVRISVDVSPDQTYTTLTHASVALKMEPATSLASLIADARSDVGVMIANAVRTSIVASVITEMKEAADVKASDVPVDDGATGA